MNNVNKIEIFKILNIYIKLLTFSYTLISKQKKKII